MLNTRCYYVPYIEKTGFLNFKLKYLKNILRQI